MTLDEALHECVSGARMTASHMQPGCYVEHSFSRGFLRCWPVDHPSDEPNRTQCDFVANKYDRDATDWHEIERPSLAVDHSPVDKWGQTTIAAIAAELPKPAPKRDLQAEALALISKPAAPAPTPGVWGVPSIAADPVPVKDKWGLPAT